MGLRFGTGLRLDRGPDAPSLTVRQLSILVISTTEGFAVEERVDPSWTRHRLGPTAGGEQQEWTLFCLGLGAPV